jgi:diguanylate cyclase (GGDEF)-like protein
VQDWTEDALSERDDPRVKSEIRRRQFRAYSIHLPVTAPAILCLSALSVWAFSSTEYARLAWISAAVVWLTEIATLIHVYMKHKSGADIRKLDIVFVSLAAAVIACALMAPITFVYPTQPAAPRIVVVAVVSALIGTGGFVLAPIAPAAFAWTICMSAMATISLLGTRQSHDHLLTLLLVGYAVIILIVIKLASTNYVDLVRAETRAERQKAWVDLLLKDFEGSARDWLWETDQDGRLHHISVKLIEALSIPRAKLNGHSLVDLLRDAHAKHGLAAAEEHDFLRLRLASRRPFRDQIVPVTVAGTMRWWSLSAKPLFNAQGMHAGWRGVGSDVTEAKVREQEMTQLANFDSLTGLANRRQFQACLESALRKLDGRTTVDLCMIDLDNFKSVNDRLGHAVGDEILRAAAARIDAARGADDLLFRLGGDEYALISTVARNNDARLDAGNALLAALNEPISVGDSLIELHASIGIATAPEHGRTPEALMRAADAALYAAKDAGRGRVSLYDRELDARSKRRASLQSELALAVEQNAFELHYQPQIDTRTMEVIGFEALMRWPRGGRKLLAPSEFIPIAEESGMIVPMGQWALRRACADCQTWPSHLFVAVNCSAVQFASRTLIDAVDHAIASSGLAPQRLEIEITESSLVEDSAHARETLKALRTRGHRIALDDFGTGYSSLAYLRSFPIDRLKIDSAFTAGLLQDGNGEASAIVRAIMQLASALKLRTTAEGVETVAQLDALRARGCFESQGYFFAHPMAGVDVAAFLVAWETERNALLERTSSAIA